MHSCGTIKALDGPAQQTTRGEARLKFVEMGSRLE